MCVNALPAYMYVHRRHAWCMRRSEEDVLSRSGVKDGFESPRGCGESNLGSLQERQMLVTTEPSL